MLPPVIALFPPLTASPPPVPAPLPSPCGIRRGLGEDVLGVAGAVAQFAAEPVHHFADQPGFAGPFRTTDPLQQLVVGQHPPGVDRKLEQQLVLGGRQPRRTPCHRHPVSGVVDG